MALPVCDLHRIPLSGDCSLRLRGGREVGRSYDTIDGAFDIDIRNRDITLAIDSQSDGVGVKRPPEAIYDLRRTWVTSEIADLNKVRWVIDLHPDQSTSVWAQNPVRELQAFENVVSLDSQTGGIPIVYDQKYPKNTISAYELAKRINPNLRTPYLDELRNQLGDYSHKLISLNTSELAKFLGGANGVGRLSLTLLTNSAAHDMTSPSVSLEFTLRNGKWESIKCSQ